MAPPFVRLFAKPVWRLATAASVVGLVCTWYVHVNREPMVFFPTEAMPDPNARDDYLRAISLLSNKDTVSEALNSADQFKSGGHAFTGAEKAELVDLNESALEALHAGFGHRFRNPPRDFLAPTPEYSGYRALARVCRLKSEVQANKGEYAGAVMTSLDAVQLGGDVPRGGNLLTDLVGIACESLGERSIWPWIDHLDAEQARSAARRLEEIDIRRTAFTDVLQAEKISGEKDLLRRMHGRNTFQFGWEYGAAIAGEMAMASGDQPASKENLPIRYAFGMLPYSKTDIIDGFSRVMDGLAASSRKPWQQFKSDPGPVMPEDPINSDPNMVFRAGTFKDVSTIMENRLLIASLGLQAYRAHHGGANPTSLNGLVQDGILKQMPIDPFSANGNTPFGYQRLPDGNCRLYSVGPDGIDDRGKPIVNRIGNGSRRRNWPEQSDKGDWVVGVDTVRDGRQ